MTRTNFCAVAFSIFALLGAAVSARGGCSDEEFLNADRLYQTALKEGPSARKIEMLEQAFAACPAHGAFTQGYLVLGKLYHDAGNKEKALYWLREAQRFGSTMLEASSSELMQVNRLLALLHKDSGNHEKALVHINIYRALAAKTDKEIEKTLLQDADAFLSVVYSPRTITETLAVDKSIAPEHWSKLNRIEVYFEFGRAALNEEARHRLDSVGKALQGDSLAACTLIVEGHTDEVGPASMNCDLGKRRARAVEQYLTSRWGKDLKMCPVSYGKSGPVMTREGHDRKEWEKIDRFNRRVVIWNSGVQKQTVKDLTVEHDSRSPCGKRE